MTIKIKVENYGDNNKNIDVLSYHDNVLVDTVEVPVGESADFWLHSKRFIMVCEKEII